MPTIERQTNRVSKSASSVNGQTDSAWDLIDSLHLLVYGDSATGKTRLWSTFPGPILALICSGSSRPGELKSINTPELRKKIDARVIRRSDDVLRHLERAKDFVTVVQDHGSGLQDLLLKEELGLDDIPATKAWGIASGEQWQSINTKTITFFRAMLDLSCHVVIVAQERVFKGKDEGVQNEIIRPVVGGSLTPTVARWVNPACDYVVQTFKRPVMIEAPLILDGKDTGQKTVTRGKGVDYCIRCEPHDTFMTKFRVPPGAILPDVIVNPTFAKIASVAAGTYQANAVRIKK